MIASRFKHHALAAAGACLLAACGGSQLNFAPAGTTQAPTAAQAYARSLLYVDLNLQVDVYTYPGGKPLGALGWGGYLCSDRLGNIILAGGEGISYVWVFPHGGSNPIATLYNPGGLGGCSVDANSENIAVAAEYPSVVVFPYNPKRGWRLAREYNDPKMRASLYCSYDPQGNIFVDGYSTSIAFRLAELPKGSSQFTTITLDRVIHSPGSMQWNGNDLVVEDAGKSSSSPAVIYRFAINGSSGHMVRATTLKNSVASGQFLILGRTIIGPAKQNSLYGLGFWRYPKGGTPGKILSTNGQPTGEALSPK